ncbi:MAG: TonB-dependent receptor [Ignavibacteriales bacterium]|nr:TonB-dependent receptor [Ignavibacteriales bacterium]MCF8435725.1 TonB-dependent receptor [Ignavibacteriales bacterium]
MIHSNTRMILLILFFGIFTCLYGSTGKIAGTVIEKETGEPLPFANVMIEGSTLGAATDLEGNFVILNVKPGVYSVTASIVGYQKQTITDVRVSSGFTTKLAFSLSSGSINLPAVIVQGERNPLIRQDNTNPTVSITSETIDELPVDQISDILRLQAGVAVGNDGQLHFRGGYGNEVAYTLNGVSLNDPYGNNSAIGLATNAVQEVSVSTGTFSAEYGNALSGIVNYVTKEGSDKYTFSLRAYGGDYVSGRTSLFNNIDDIDPLNRARTELTFGGQIPEIPQAKFFISGVFENSKGYIYGNRIYNPYDSYLTVTEFPTGDPRKGTSSSSPYYFNPYGTDSTGLPTGDGDIVPLNTSRNINLQGNLSYKFTPTLKLKFESVFEDGVSNGGGGLGTYESKYNPDALGKSYSRSYHNALEFTHTVSQYMFYTLQASYTDNYGKYYLYEDYDDPRYLPSSIYERTLGNTIFITGGTDNLRFFRQTTTKGIKGDLVAQLFGNHEVKFGFEGRFFDMNVESYSVEIGKFDPNAEGNFGSLSTFDMFDPTTQIIRRIPSDTSLYTYYERKPSSFSAYLRDKIELSSSMILNLGLRYEYFNPNAYYNDNLSEEYQTELEGSMFQNLKKASVKHMLSPRFSVSYPITDQGIIRFSYGHFYQNGSLSSLYRNPNFFTRLGATPSFGNPDVEPQKSVQYEMGLLQGLTNDLRLELTGYYKDVTNYIYTQSVFTSRGKEYSVLTNLAYTNVRGVTLSLFKRRSTESMVQAGLDYTFQIAEGNRTAPQEDLFFSEVSGKQTEVFLVPLDFDRQHIINATVNLIEPNDWTLGFVAYYQTGTPYTPSLPAQLVPITFIQNSASRPTQWNIDMKFEKYFTWNNIKYSVFLQVDNIFDTEREVSVYASSGRALTNVEQILNDYQFDDLRRRINNGDPGLIPLSQVDNYYSQRPQNVGRPREVRVGFSVVFN